MSPLFVKGCELKRNERDTERAEHKNTERERESHPARQTEHEYWPQVAKRIWQSRVILDVSTGELKQINLIAIQCSSI